MIFNGITLVPNFVTIGQVDQKNGNTHKQHGDNISLRFS
jgi:hypothetical protein